MSGRVAPPPVTGPPGAPGPDAGRRRRAPAARAGPPGAARRPGSRRRRSANSGPVGAPVTPSPPAAASGRTSGHGPRHRAGRAPSTVRPRPSRAATTRPGRPCRPASGRCRSRRWSRRTGRSATSRPSRARGASDGRSPSTAEALPDPPRPGRPVGRRVRRGDGATVTSEGYRVVAAGHRGRRIESDDAAPTGMRTGVRRVAPTMGTMASIVVHDDAPADVVDTAIGAVLAELERLEAIFSTYRADSVISAINRGERHPLDGPAEVVDVLDACTWLEQVTGGAFRARRPEPPFPFDPAGFVKGWATERATGALDAAGLEHWCVSVGGDLQVRGRPAAEAGQRTAVAHRRGRPAPPRPGPRLLRPPRRRGGHVGHGRAGAPPVGRPDRAAARRAGLGHGARPPSDLGRRPRHRGLRPRRRRPGLDRGARGLRGASPSTRRARSA